MQLCLFLKICLKKVNYELPNIIFYGPDCCTICILQDFNSVLVRYFNPIGAHESGRIGEDPTGIPNNLMPYVAQVASGKLEQLSVFGNDYPTRDGSGVRDYIHVVDLALGHVAALDKLIDGSVSGLKVYNLGTGNGYSVLEMVKAMEKASGVDIPYAIKPRREGDVGEVYADCRLAKEELNWVAARDLNTMCKISRFLIKHQRSNLASIYVWA